MKSILDPSFCYTNSIETDLRKTFARVRCRLREEAQVASTVGIEVTRKVLPFHSHKVGSGEEGLRSKHHVAMDRTLNDS